MGLHLVDRAHHATSLCCPGLPTSCHRREPVSSQRDVLDGNELPRVAGVGVGCSPSKMHPQAFACARRRAGPPMYDSACLNDCRRPTCTAGIGCSSYLDAQFNIFNIRGSSSRRQKDSRNAKHRSCDLVWKLKRKRGSEYLASV